MRILDRLRASPCLAKLPKHNAQWLDLLRAVALRDGARMTALAGAMLEASDAEAKTYLIHAAMLGALSRQRSDEALAVWQKHGQKLTGAGSPAIALDTRVLVALAHMEATRQAKLDR